MVKLILASSLLALEACSGRSHATDNARAKARIFAPAEVSGDSTAPPPLDLQALGSSLDVQDRVLGMSEAELSRRVGAFRLHARLHLSFSGSGRTGTVDEERLVEQSKDGDLHLRLLDKDGGGMEILWVAGQAYGRSRYGPYVVRDRESDLKQQREEVFGALATLYSLADRRLQLRALGPQNDCDRFEVSPGPARQGSAPPRFSGRLDADTAKRFQFIYDRKLLQASGEICVDRRGAVSRANLSFRWAAGGDAGSGEVRAELSQTLTDLGGDVRIAAPEGAEPEPHRPRGPFAVLDRFGFIQRPDGG